MEETRAMVVKASLNVTYSRKSDGNESAVVNAKKMHVYVFQPNLTSTSASASGAGEGQGIRPVPIINPFDISVKYSKSPRPNSAVMSQRVFVDVQPVEFFFSYQVFLLYVS